MDVSEIAIRDDLERSATFADCSPHDIAQLVARSSRFREKRKFVIAEQEVPFPFMGVVAEGVVGVTASIEGHPGGAIRRLRLYEVEPGGTFADVNVLDGEAPLGQISVLSKYSEWVLIPRDIIWEVTSRDPALLKRIAGTAAQRSRELTRRLASQAVRSAIARVADVLLPYAQERPGMHRADPRLDDMTQSEIAASAGLVKEVAARAIAEIEKCGGLQRERGRVRFIDRDLLNILLQKD